MNKNTNVSIKTNAILNTIKQLFTIIFPLITFPYATRILGASSYGKIAFSSSIISYISLISSLGINSYAIREGAKVRNDKNKLRELSNQLFTLNIYSTLISYVCLILLILFWDKAFDYKEILAIQSITIICNTFGVDWVNSIFEDYKYITKRYIACQTIALLLMFVIVKSNDDYLKYAFISVFGSVLANISNIFYIKKRYNAYPHFVPNTNFIKHLKPVIYIFSISIASIIYINSDITILGIYRNDNEVGLYNCSSRIYSCIKQLLNAMLNVAIPRISFDLHNRKKNYVEKELEKIVHTLIVFSFPISAGIIMLSDSIVMLLSGIEYIDAAGPLRILGIAIIFATLSCFFMNVVMIPLGLERKVLKITAISAILNIVLNIMFIPNYGMIAAAITTLLSEMVVASYGAFCCRKFLKISILKYIPISLFEFFGTTLICFFVNKIGLNDIFTLMISIVICAIYCFVLICAFDKEISHEIIGLVRRK